MRDAEVLSGRKARERAAARASTGARTRREFLAASAVAAGAALAGGSLAFPRILRAQDKASVRTPVLGDGAHRYEALHDWGQLPARIRWGNTHGVAVDKDGNVYVKHTVHASSECGDAIVVFDRDGRFVRSFGAAYRGGAHGLLLSREREGEFLYLADFQRGVFAKTDLAGKAVWEKTCPLESGLYGSKDEFHPTNIAVVPPGPRGGEFFVADGYGKSWIHHYSAAGEYLRSWGGPGKERGQVNCPHGIMIDTRGAAPRVVVADRSNRRLQYFDLDGRHQRFVTDELRSPCHFDQRDGLLLVPDLEARVTILDRDDKLVAHLGDGENFALRDKPREQFVPGRFIAPHSACFDAAGNIFVVEWVEVGRVTLLRRVS